MLRKKRGITIKNKELETFIINLAAINTLVKTDKALQILTLLEINGKLSLYDIHKNYSKVEKISYSTILEYCLKLQKEGFIEKTTSTKGKRKYTNFNLTQKGRKELYKYLHALRDAKGIIT